MLGSQKSKVKSQKSKVKIEEAPRCLCTSDELQRTRFTFHAPPFTPPSVVHLLAEAEAALIKVSISTARLDAEVLLSYVLGVNRAKLYARLQDLLSRDQVEAFWGLLQRRARHEPLSYITGVREFWSLEFTVDPQVLIPRPETEIVVETVLRLLSHSAFRLPSSVFRVVDIGTGSGCIALALATELPQAEIWATDISPAALMVASENAQHFGVTERIRFRQGDLFAAVAQEVSTFDLVVSNPPYITRSDLVTLQLEVREWEPQSALDGGRDGLDFYRRLIDESPVYLRTGGWLVMELGAGQSPEVMQLLRARRDFADGFCVRDYAGHERVAVAYKKDTGVS